MRNLNEPRRRPEDIKNDIPEDKTPAQSEAEVISLQDRRTGKRQIEHPLIPKRQIEDLRARWTMIQASFVDEPKKAVEDADTLVSSAIKQIAEGFREQRDQLEKQWTRGNEGSTEDLRISLQHYRSFFDRLLSL
jgi:hypothetical protein